MIFPATFLSNMRALLGPDFPAFEAALRSPAPVSIRVNPFRRPISGVAPEPIARHQAAAVPWHPEGFYLPERPVFTLDPTLHAGAYYVQEASSMFLREALRQCMDFSNNLRILDLCAAPGGKSTLLLSMLSPESLLVSNEVIRARTGPLRENLERWGCPNVAITSAEVEAFGELEGWFDVVVTDAPCSGEGMFRKDPDAVGEWSPAHVELCSGRQRRILAAAVAALKPGGVLAYSTCTFNRAENEGNATWLATEFGLEPLRLALPADWGLVESEAGYRFYPHRVQGEGFFISLFRKKESPAKRHALPAVFKNLKPLPKNLLPVLSNWVDKASGFRFFQTPSGEVVALPAEQERDYLLLDKFLKIKWFGTALGEFKGKDLVPSHALALSKIAAPQLPGLELAREQALLFLKKETFDLPPDAPKGWVLARHAGLNLGWMKVLPNRFNNYLPGERRIRMGV